MDYNWQNQSGEDLPQVRDYQLHHIGLRLRSNDANILNVIHQILYHFQLPADHQYQPQINFDLQVVESSPIPPLDFPSQLKLVSFDENQKYYSGEEGMLYTLSPDKFMVACDLRSLTATGVINADHASSSWLIFHQIFYPTLAEILKQLQLFNIHTAAVAHDGVGILFPARARSGKSTITISMLKAGFGFLSDDICFVHKNSSNPQSGNPQSGKPHCGNPQNGKLLLLGFPEPIRIWDETAQLFPELSFLNDRYHCTHLKRTFCVEQVFPHSIRHQAVPKFLILPQISSSPRSQLHPISKTDALVELIPQSLMVANKNIVKHHLEVLTQLVDECQCFRLQAGQDILNIPRLIKDIL